MNDQVQNRLEEVVQSAEGPGRMLREARKVMQLSTAEIAQRLNLDLPVIESIELDDYASLPPATFIKGYLCAYARLVRLDEAQIVAAFETVIDPKHSPTPLEHPAWLGDQADFSDSKVRWFTWVVVAATLGAAIFWAIVQFQKNNGGDIFNPSNDSNEALESRAGLTDPLAIAADNVDPSETAQAATPAVSAASPGLPTQTSDAGTPAPVSTPELESAVQTQAETAARETADASASQASAAEKSLADTPPTAATENDGTSQPPSQSAGEPEADRASADGAARDASENQPDPSARTSTTETTRESASDGASQGPSETAISPPQPGATSSEAVVQAPQDSNPTGNNETAASAAPSLTISVTEDCWISVLDADQRVLVYRIVTGPTEVTVSGNAPFKVTLGNARAASLKLNGKPIDFSDSVKGNIARLTIPAN